jgi:hypothetical protein
VKPAHDAQTAFPFDPLPEPEQVPERVSPGMVCARISPAESVSGTDSDRPAKYDDATLADTYRYWADSFRYSQENAIAMVTKDPENAHEWVRIAAMNKQHAADFMAKARE